MLVGLLFRAMTVATDSLDDAVTDDLGSRASLSLYRYELYEYAGKAAGFDDQINLIPEAPTGLDLCHIFASLFRLTPRRDCVEH